MWARGWGNDYVLLGCMFSCDVVVVLLADLRAGALATPNMEKAAAILQTATMSRANVPRAIVSPMVKCSKLPRDSATVATSTSKSCEGS